jgi:asparagine synthetase A
MIDWDVKNITMMDKHYKEILHPSVNLIYFCRHFEEIYTMTMNEEVLLPDIFNDIMFYTSNGINARYKVLYSPKKEEEISEKLLPQRMKQRAKRQKAHNNGLDEYYDFMMKEVEEFVKKYLFWKELIRR